MLERPKPPKPEPPQDRKRRLKIERVARHRKRIAAGRMSIAIDIDVNVLNMLVRAHWLEPREVYSRQEITAAVEAMLARAWRG